jgi:hypothetical protein
MMLSFCSKVQYMKSAHKTIYDGILCIPHFMEMKPHEKSLGRNPLSDAPYRNKGKVLNGQGLGDAPYLDLDTVLNEQRSGRHILSDVLHRRPGVVKNEQGSSHLTRWM